MALGWRPVHREGFLHKCPLSVGSTRRPLSSSLLGLPYRNHKKELLRGLWVRAYEGFTRDLHEG